MSVVSGWTFVMVLFCPGGVGGAVCVLSEWSISGSLFVGVGVMCVSAFWLGVLVDS